MAIIRKVVRSGVWMPLTVALVAVGSLLVGSGAAAWDDDPFGDYEAVQFITAGLGPVFLSGDLADTYSTGMSAGIRLGMRTAPNFSVSSAINGVMIGNQLNSADGRLYYDVNFTGQWRLTNIEASTIPHLDFGGGVIGLDGTALTLIGGVGVNLRLFERGSLGFQVLVEWLPSESSYLVPLLLTFNHYP